VHSTASVGRNQNSDLAEAALAAVVRALRHAVDVRIGAGSTFEDREETLLEVANEACRRCLEADLQKRADSFAAELSIDGSIYRQHEPGEVSYHSLCGPLSVRRFTYRKAGVHNGPTVVPVELVAPIVEGGTPALAFSVAQGIAKAPSRHYLEDMHAAFRLPPSRSTIERMAQRLGGGAKQQVPAIEPVLRATEELPAKAHAIAIGLDRTTVPIIEERPPGEVPTTRRKKRTTPYQRKPPHPFDVAYRMAYVGTFSIVDAEGTALVARKYAATPEEGPDELVERLMADVERARAQNSGLPIVIVQDGAPELWGLIWMALRARGIKKWSDVIDRFHANEHLANALALVIKDEAIRSQMYARWQTELDTTDRAMRTIRRWLEARRGQVANSNLRLFDTHLSYFFEERFFNYARYRRAGFPIASGVTEGACKSLIAARFKRSGQRWYQDGLTAVLTLRALHQSDRLNAFWAKMLPLFKRDVAAV
jgi:hypothetical protein